MRQPRHAAPLLLLGLLFVLCWSNARAACHVSAVVREVPQRGRGAVQAYTVALTGDDDGELKPIRIQVFTEGVKNTENKELFCKEKGESRTNLLKEYVTCTENNILTNEKKQLYETTIIPGAVKLHAERLLVKPTTESIQIPRSFGDPCSGLKAPTMHKASGVSDADMIIYAAAEPMSHKAAWGATCATYTDTRPSIGALNFDPEYMTDTMWSVRVAAHAMAHALGFSFQDMQQRGMVKSDANVRGKAKTLLVTGTNTVRVAKKHFKCNDIEGMELENDDGVKGEARSHWEMRNAKDELMAPTVTVGYYTELTMAVFADLGYFGVNWSMAEPMSWGKDAGCGFLQKKCKEIENVHTALPHMFCDSAGKETLRCTSDRYSVGTCTGSIVENKGTVDNQDVCPIVASHEGGVQKSVNSKGCTDSTVVDLPGSLTGSGSWCLDAEALMAKPKNGDNAEGDFKEVNGVCAQVLCGDEGTVKVKYLGNDEWHDCVKGEFITPKSSQYFQGEDGKIKCPKYDEVCTIASNGSSLVTPTDAVHDDSGETVKQGDGGAPQSPPAPPAPAESPPRDEERPGVSGNKDEADTNLPPSTGTGNAREPTSEDTPPPQTAGADTDKNGGDRAPNTPVTHVAPSSEDNSSPGDGTTTRPEGGTEADGSGSSMNSGSRDVPPINASDVVEGEKNNSRANLSARSVSARSGDWGALLGNDGVDAVAGLSLFAALAVITVTVRMPI